MDIDGEQAQGRSDAVKGLLLAATLAVVVVVAGAAWWWLSRPAPAPAAKSPGSVPPSTAPAAALPPTTRATVDEAPSEPARRRERAARERPAPAPEPTPGPAAPAGPVLVVESDVPGASVFVNRKYLGTTPLRSTEITAGPVQLNASAEGYDGVVQEVEVAASGPTEVRLRFKDVRLDATVPAVHKHGMGSCEGTLRATPAGLRYDTANKSDAFTLAFDELDTFEVDYLQKNLKVKKRGGKTWNFSTRAASADPLFVFHRDVDKARAKLASR